MNRSGARERRDAGRDEGLFALIETAHALEARLERALDEVGLSMAKQGVLSVLAEAREAVPLGDLAELKSCVRSNITQLVDRLEADGLVRRVRDPNDRRVVRAELTPEGRRRQAAGAKRIARQRAEFAAALPRAERDALLASLAALR